MKHTNQDEASRNQGATTDQNKKTNKGQQNGKNQGMDQHTQSNGGTKDHSNPQSGDTSNWQKDKQGNRK